jgi:hypothetical protein
MAVTENKRSSAHTQPATTSTAKHRSATRAANPSRKKREKLPPSLRFNVTKRGKTTIRRYPGRSFHRFEEAKGKALDYVEFFTMGEYHCIDVAFEDKTAMHFVIEPSFKLETDYADWKTGNWRPIKRWPTIPSAGFNS